MKEANVITTITMKKGTTKPTFLEFTSWLDRQGKLISNAEQPVAGHFIAIACFDNKLDYLAFLVSTDLCYLTLVPPNASSEDQP